MMTFFIIAILTQPYPRDSRLYFLPKDMILCCKSKIIISIHQPNICEPLLCNILDKKVTLSNHFMGIMLTENP